MKAQFCNENNIYSNSIENINNNDSAEILNDDEPVKTSKVSYIDEFEQVFNEYKEQQINFVENIVITNASIVTDPIIDMDIDLAETVSNVQNCKSKQVDLSSNEVCNNCSAKPKINENLEINNASPDDIDIENTLEFTKPEIDKTSNKELIDGNSKSIKIDIDIQNEITDERINTINNAFFEDFVGGAGPIEKDYIDFEIDDIKLCGDPSVTDINYIIDLTDSPDIIDLTDSPRFELETSPTVDNNIYNKENTSYVGNSGDSMIDIHSGDEIKDIHISDSESDCSFHSSDFELITEEEAKLDGLIVNFRQQNEINDDNSLNNGNIIDMCIAGPSNDYAYRENHRIPEGDEFYNMFYGIYAPANISDMIFLENKSVVSTRCMDVEIDGLGFDLAALNQEVDKEYQDEAKETAKKILNTYHEVNERKRRRRQL